MKPPWNSITILLVGVFVSFWVFSCGLAPQSTPTTNSPASATSPSGADVASRCDPGFVLESDVCVRCPKQADCCDDGRHLNPADELCWLIPDECQSFALPVQECNSDSTDAPQDDPLIDTPVTDPPASNEPDIETASNDQPDFTPTTAPTLECARNCASGLCDADCDGWNDDVEIEAGTDPCDPFDPPSCPTADIVARVCDQIVGCDSLNDPVLDPESEFDDQCPSDPLKTEPGICGCGVSEVDSDADLFPDCIDNCPAIYNPDQIDSDFNFIGDACDTVALPPLVQTFLLANDGTFLGNVNPDSFDLDSLANSFGTFGSGFGQLSIWNEFGTYGSDFSTLSPWNEFTTTPPIIVDGDGLFIAYLTANSFLVPGIHPNELAIRIGRLDVVR